MTELPFTYLKELAIQVIFISVFLGGFCATILGTLILSKNESNVLKKLIIATSISATSFIVTVFAMTQIVIVTIPGYPNEITNSDLVLPRFIGTLAFFIGLLSLMSVISISGWLQSKKLGIITTLIGIIGLLIIFTATFKFEA